MAKPKHGRWNNYASPATHDTPLPSSSYNHRHHLPYHPGSNHPPHRSSARSLSPSPAVLSALAIIATTTPVVAGGPLPVQTAPPSFLCPFIERDNVDPISIILPRITIPAASTPTPTPTSTLSKNSKRSPIADKYVKGSDDLWRKTDEWTLYGSTCCPSSTSVAFAQAEPTSSSTSMPTSIPTPAEFDTSVLPAGWDHTSPGSSTESTIILALAIVLAGSICVFMLGCVIWRKRKKKATDTERKVSHKLRPDDASEDDEREKDARGKMRIWAKASARWKVNIRHSARRRRKKSIAARGVNRPQSPTLNDSQEDLAGVSSAVSRRGSFMSQEPDASRSETASSHNDNTTAPPEPAPSGPTLPLRSASPPTYGSSVVPRITPSVSGDSNLTASRENSHPFANSHPSPEEDEPLPYLPPSDGHVATDDKAQLARIHELASSPRSMPNDASTTTMVSAPAWHEVEDNLEDLGVNFGEPSTSVGTFGHPPLFPPPPAQADVSSGYLDGDPFHYGEGDDPQVSVPTSGPLAPSFEGSPSAPPIGDLDLEPSAPSFEDEDDVYQDWAGVSSFPVVPTSGGSPAEAAESSLSPSSMLPHTRASVPRDGVLPRYQP